mmetsp:Transcript_45719/g.56067  ORF Transcript_45719/g.56067 Transcript_45719/m.56067 type:complete len:129 (-) Transcript_45719:152-538(-)
MDAKGRFYYKGHPPTSACRLKPFPCDIGLEAYYRKHPILDNQKSGKHYFIVTATLLVPGLFLCRLISWRLNAKARKERGVNAYYWGWRPPLEWNALENATPLWDNPCYDKWLEKQDKIRARQALMDAV